MKSFDSPSKASANRASAAIQRVQGPTKTVVNNRPSAVKQRRLQEAVNKNAKINSFQSTGQTLFAPIQRILSDIGRVKKEEDSWQNLVMAAPVPISQDRITLIEKYDAQSAGTRIDTLKQEYQNLKAIDSELDYLTPQQKKSTKYKNRIKERIEGQYQRIVDLANDAYNEQQSIYDNAFIGAVNAVRDYANTSDRKHLTGGAIKKGAAFVKHEKENVIPGIIVNEHQNIPWRSLAAFQKNVLEKYNATKQEANQALNALSAVDQQSLDAEKAAIEVQLNTWRNNLAFNAVGCNADGTWGTSATGVGNNFAITRVNPAVWAKLRSWWIQKSRAFVTPSDTSTHSLKMDRAGNDDQYSPRINYHINVG